MPRAHTSCQAEFRAAAVRLTRCSEKSIPALAADPGVPTETLRRWLRRANADMGTGPPGAPTTDERDELRRLRREAKTLQQERETSRKFSLR